MSRHMHLDALSSLLGNLGALQPALVAAGSELTELGSEVAARDERIARLELAVTWMASGDACAAGTTLLFHALGIQRRGARIAFPRDATERMAVERLVRRAPWLAESVRKLGEGHEIWRNLSYAILRAADREIRAAKLAEAA